MRSIAAAHTLQPNQLLSWEERQVGRLHAIYTLFRILILQGIMLSGLDTILAAVVSGREASEHCTSHLINPSKSLWTFYTTHHKSNITPLTLILRLDAQHLAQAGSRRREPGDSAVAPWNVAQLQQTGFGAQGPAVTVVEKVRSADDRRLPISALLSFSRFY